MKVYRRAFLLDKRIFSLFSIEKIDGFIFRLGEMDVTLAKTFLTVTDTGSFVLAAESLHVTQSTVSSRIKTLEDLLGRSLFERSKSGVRLTLAGNHFHKHALAILRIWEHARVEVKLAEAHRDHLAIGAQPSFWDGFLLSWLGWMRENIPDIAITATAASSVRLMDRLTEGTLDLAIMYRPTERPGLIIEHLFDEELILVSASGKQQTPLPDYIFMNWGPEFEADHALAFPESRIAGLTLDLGAVGINALLATGGAGYFPARTAHALIKQGRLTEIEKLPRFVYPAYAVFPEDRDEEAYEPILSALKRHVQALPEHGRRQSS
jgi:DNA-binding transcriptional LysR family regulator